MGFALALAARFLSQRPASALIVSEGFADQELGALHGPGLVAHGLSLSRLVFVRAPDAALAFWAIEEALKCGAPAAVVGEIWNLKGYSLAASRRLLLAARKGRVPALLVLASAYGQDERLSSAAETRFEIAAAPSARTPAAAGPDLPGPFACGARLVKARLARAGPEGAFQAFDVGRVIRLEWRSQDLTFKDMTFRDTAFDDQAISLPLAAASGDRPRAPWVAAAIVEHSKTVGDPIGRFHRTFAVVFTMVFGTVDQALSAARAQHRRHAAIHGRLPITVGPFCAGSRYQANDLAALRWVYATLVETALMTHDFVLPPLTGKDGHATMLKVISSRRYLASLGLRCQRTGGSSPPMRR